MMIILFKQTKKLQFPSRQFNFGLLFRTMVLPKSHSIIRTIKSSLRLHHLTFLSCLGESSFGNLAYTSLSNWPFGNALSKCKCPILYSCLINKHKISFMIKLCDTEKKISSWQSVSLFPQSTSSALCVHTRPWSFVFLSIMNIVCITSSLARHCTTS